TGRRGPRPARPMSPGIPSEAHAIATVSGVDVAVATDHWIAGERVGPATGERFEVCSPIDGSHLADVAAGGPDDVDAAVGAARAAFPDWAALGPRRRAEILLRVAEGIRGRRADFAAV